MQVTLKLQPGLPSLRTPALKACVEQAIDAGHERFGMRLLNHTLEKDGLSLLVTAPHRRALSRGIQGISVRIARAVNRKLERKGRLFADRYDAQLADASGQAIAKAATNKAASKPAVTKVAAVTKAPINKSAIARSANDKAASRRSSAVSNSAPPSSTVRPTTAKRKAPARKAASVGGSRRTRALPRPAARA